MRIINWSADVCSSDLRTAADVAGPGDVVDARAPHRLRAPAGRRPQGGPDAVRARRRGRGGVALDRQRQRGLERGVDAGAGLPRRLVGAGRRVRLPARDPGPQRTQEEGVVSEAGRHVLLADIGGTNARFALADTAAQLPLLEDSVKEYAVADFPSLGDAALHYFDDGGTRMAGGRPVHQIGRAHV